MASHLSGQHVEADKARKGDFVAVESKIDTACPTQNHRRDNGTMEI
jgi:hypothetical protein